MKFGSPKSLIQATMDKIQSWYKVHSHQNWSAQWKVCGDKCYIISLLEHIYIYLYIYIITEKKKLCTQEWYYLSAVRVCTILCNNKSADRKTGQSKTILLSSVSMALLTKMRNHHSQCWSLVPTLICHPSCPMMNPVRDHHQSLDPCACSASEYPSSVPCIESSLVEVHRNVSPPIPCQKASNEQEVGYARQCTLVQPWRCCGHKIKRFHWLKN
jgi:hypothetical protein